MTKFIDVTYMLKTKAKAPNCPHCGYRDGSFSPPVVVEGCWFSTVCSKCKERYKCEVMLYVETERDDLGYLSDSDTHLFFVVRK